MQFLIHGRALSVFGNVNSPTVELGQTTPPSIANGSLAFLLKMTFFAGRRPHYFEFL
jgi:hypothetical protein